MPTGIDYLDEVWNVTGGCTPIREGCKNCYARNLHTMRHKAYKNGAKLPECYSMPFSQVRLFPERLEQPFHWKKPRRIGVCFMSDLFHDDVPFDFIDRVIHTILQTYDDSHFYAILTKRPQNMKNYFSDKYTLGNYLLPHLKNLIIGASVSTQRDTNDFLPILLQTPVEKRFMSAEPMLGAIDLSFLPESGAELDWVICGGESGSGARPLHPELIRSLRDQCVAAGVPFWFKQWGEFIPSYDAGMRDEEKDKWKRSFGQAWVKSAKYRFPDGQGMVRVGKKAAGNVLDGLVWNQLPEGI